jgi:hypothetical protein
MGCEVSVLWSRKKKTFYEGSIEAYDSTTGLHTVAFKHGGKGSCAFFHTPAL